MRTAVGLILSLLLLASLPLPASGQVILNTERFQIEEVEGFHLGADLSASIQRGNTKVMDLSTSGIVGFSHQRHWPRLIFGGKYLRDDTRSILDQQFAQFRYSYILTPALQTFHFVQAQKNETLLLQSRWLVGTGLRYTAYRTDRTMIAAGTGVMGEWERLDRSRIEDPDEITTFDAIRMANLMVIRREFESGARLVNISYLQPDLGQFSDTRILNDLGLAVPITPHVNMTASMEWRRDTRPPANLERDDLTLRMGIGIDIR